ncbi:MAG: helix-turn-helix transcriptional regulator [Ruminococcus sp.]|nr:helix-turn-helix transcriptional regulator [Ruminococcus sp.]
MSLGKKITLMREKLGITQTELAERIQANQSTISKIEHGINKPSAAVIYKIAKVLGCTVEYLMDDERRKAG